MGGSNAPRSLFLQFSGFTDSGVSTKNVINFQKEKKMAIRLHNFISSQKRYIQVESQPHHISGIFRTIMRSKSMRGCEFVDVYSAYYKCEEDGTITFYQSGKSVPGNSGIWTYVMYECPEGEDKIFPDSFVVASAKPLNELLAGKKLLQVAVDINEYLTYKYNEPEYLDIQLPLEWNTQEGVKIASVLLEEFKALHSSSFFSEDMGKEYMKTALNGFIETALEVLEADGTANDFEAAQYYVLNKMKTDDIANLIIQYNDYRIWQAALPTKSKAVEYAFNTALKLICRMK